MGDFSVSRHIAFLPFEGWSPLTSKISSWMLFKLKQALTDIKITSHLTRKPLEPRSQKWVKHDQRLNTVIESYDTYDDALDYLKDIGCLMDVNIYSVIFILFIHYYMQCFNSDINIIHQIVRGHQTVLFCTNWCHGSRDTKTCLHQIV